MTKSGSLQKPFTWSNLRFSTLNSSLIVKYIPLLHIQYIDKKYISSILKSTKVKREKIPFKDIIPISLKNALPLHLLRNLLMEKQHYWQRLKDHKFTIGYSDHHFDYQHPPPQSLSHGHFDSQNLDKIKLILFHYSPTVQNWIISWINHI